MKKEDLFKELVSKLDYLDEEELSKISLVYNYSLEKHYGQFRKSGEEFIIHPLNVTLILTTIKADFDTICASLLHDVIEDTETSKKDIEKLFGRVIANLVDGVTKINSLNVSTDNEYLTSYYKKIIVGMSEDVRVIIIKLADRLHNMRTLHVLQVEKQKATAKETLEILAPIAHRLGMQKIKSELEDLSLRYLKPDVYFDIVEKLNNTKIERDSYVVKMLNEVSSLLMENDIPHEIKGRAKSVYSIYKKLDNGRSFNDIYDLLALRILVEKEQDCYLALGLIHSKYKPVSKRFKDYIAMPKTNLYQTLHTTIFGLDGNLFEIQIRTYDMDQIAENGIASHWAYKERKNAALEMQNLTEQKLQFFKSIIEINEEKLSSEEFIESLKSEVLENNIYVYTPKGDVIELPLGATPIDFAYRVHTKIGDKLTGAYVNNNMVPLSHELKDGDIVKAITNNSSIGPSREWLKIAVTTSAKGHIKAFFNKINKEEYIIKGEELLIKELKRRKVAISEFMKGTNLKDIFKAFHLIDTNDMYLNIGNGKHSAESIVKFKYEEEEKDENLDVIKEYKIKTSLDNDILISGLDNIKTHVAACCLPVPGDDIVGFITRGSGISIHRKICNNLFHEDEKIIDAKWSNDISNKYETTLIVYTNTKDNILIEIVQTASNIKVQLEHVNLINKGENAIFKVNALVNDVEELEKFINDLKKIKHVNDVERD